MTVPIKVIAFDAYGTLFDVHSVNEAITDIYGEQGKTLSEVWRTKQLEYAFLRQIMGRYRDFWALTKDALFFAARSLEIEVTEEDEEKLLGAYLNLKPYSEVPGVLEQLSDFTRVIFSNGNDKMLQPLVDNAGLRGNLDAALSIDPVKQFKPSPAAYHHLLSQYEVTREEVLFLSSNTWDIGGAKSFGFRTMWVNRNDNVFDQLGVQPDEIVTSLTGLSEYLLK